MNRRAFTLAAASSLAIAPAWAKAPSAALEAAVRNPRRTPRNVARDPFRHPAESLAFWGVAPTMSVVEIQPAPGYWTEILAPYLKAGGGRYTAAMDTSEGDEDLAGFKARFSDAATWGEVKITDFPPRSSHLGASGSADLVLTARNFHNWMWTPGLVDKALADFRDVLKPGGVLAVEEHRADPRPMAPEARDGYVASAYLIGAVQKAGFHLDGASDINANPKDTKDHPFGVWTLPPTLTTHARGKPTPEGFDAAKYKAIGESDRMTLRFRKI
jgi:predicted methyltransferase